jgi:hypothetical protein
MVDYSDTRELFMVDYYDIGYKRFRVYTSDVMPTQVGIQASLTLHHINLMTIMLFYASYAVIFWISAYAEMTFSSVSY